MNDPGSGTSRNYAWSVFALTFALMLSDFASRTVITPILPVLKAEWALTDTQLGALVSIISLVVGVMALPVSVLADWWGRVRSVAVMGAVWGLATMACGLSGNFVSLLIARAAVGLGEAGYGGAGGAVLMQVFPQRTRSTIAGAVLAAALFASVLSVAFGGILAEHLGWRGAFFIGGTCGVLLALAYPSIGLPYRPPTTSSLMA
jgi:MFS family permease